MNTTVTDRTETMKQRATEAVGAVADKARSTVERAASAASDAAPTGEVRDIVSSLADRAKSTIDVATTSARQAADTVKDATDAAWDAAQKASAQAGDIAGDVYERGRRASAEMIRQTQEQPIAAILVAAAVGALVGYALGSASRRA